VGLSKRKIATAPAPILANFSPSAGSWLWACANEGILPEMSRDSVAVRDRAEAHGRPEPKVQADVETASTRSSASILAQLRRTDQPRPGR
jgi:hypothetical protein